MKQKRSNQLALSVVMALGVSLVPVVLSSCGGGGSSGGGGGGTGTNPPPGYTGEPPAAGETQPNFASIQQTVFTPICSQCHIGGAAPEGLRLTADVSYGMLVNQPSSQVPNLMRVNPGNANDSYLIQKLEGTAAVGARMPFGGPFLDPSTVNAIRQWINDGAPQSASTRSAEGLVPVSAAWPTDGSTHTAAPQRIVIAAQTTLDPARIHAGSVSLVNLDDIDPATLRPRELDPRITYSSLEPTVINLVPGRVPWRPGRYEVRVSGGGNMSVADLAGNLIDGDGDGVAGGDLLLKFTVEEGQ